MNAPRKRKSSGKVTLADVAKKAGVGAMTVSRALRTPELVSEKLREKIQQVIHELGYIPNKAAGALASGQSQTIAVVLPSLTEKSCALFLPDFQKVLNHNGYHLLLGYSDYSLEQEENLIGTFLQSQPDAVVLFGSQHSQRTHQLLDIAHTPVIEIAELTSEARYQNIGVNHFAIGQACTRHLIERGCCKIGFIGARGQHSVLKNMLHGWQSALIENYLAPDHFLTSPSGATIALGAEGLAKLILREPTLDALVCSHEEIALGVLFECQRRLLKIPEDMTIICLDGSAACAGTYPELSCAQIDYSHMGKKAGECLVRMLGDEAVFFPSIDIGFTLNQRTSTNRLRSL